jgi:uncharacterized protein YwgA
MTQGRRPKRDAEKVAEIIRDAGGRIVGRTRLQKVSYLLDVAGLGEGFAFEYRHYGPYSEELTAAARTARHLGLVDEEEHTAGWGGTYSIYSTGLPESSDVPEARRALARMAAQADSVQLELAATAVFLAGEGASDPWAETERHKPEKAEGGRLDRAKELYRRLRRIDVPHPLPEIA